MDVPFDVMLESLRSGDPMMVRRFVEEYEPFIRRVIRPRLRRTGLRSVSDSLDLCQTVFGTLLIRMKGGEFDLHSLDDLERLLNTITQRKFAELVRREFAECRDRRRLEHLDSEKALIDSSTSPRSTAMTNDVLEEVCRRLPVAEQDLFNQRRSGKEWNQIAQEVGQSVELLRKRLSRALGRVAEAFRLGGRDER